MNLGNQKVGLDLLLTHEGFKAGGELVAFENLDGELGVVAGR